MQKHTAHALALFAATVACAAVGCSTATTAQARSGVAESTALGTLTDDNRRQLCDWIASQSGGYGNTTAATCDGGILVRSAFVQDEASCVARLATMSMDCAANVSQAEDCILAEIAAGPCGLSEGQPTACAPLATAECATRSPTADGG
jgi:hypothetical protein